MAENKEPAKKKTEENRYRDPEGMSKAVALAVLLLLFAGLYFLAGDFLRKTFALAVSGNVKALADYFRSFGPWAVAISFFIDVLINAGSIFPSIFISTANGLLFGLPAGIVISWLAETTGVVISFLLLRFFFRDSARQLIHKANRLQDIDRASEKKGLVWMALARMLPYFPSGILTAVGALSSMSVRDYIIANLIGKFPSTALEVVIGHDVVHYQDSTMRLTILVLVAAVIVYYGKKHIFDKPPDSPPTTTGSAPDKKEKPGE